MGKLGMGAELEMLRWIHADRKLAYVELRNPVAKIYIWRVGVGLQTDDISLRQEGNR